MGRSESASELLRLLTGETLGTLEDTKGIHIDTIHASKGREFDNVAIAACNQRMDTDTEEDENLLYVAMSRAKTRLYFTWATSVIDPWRQTVLFCRPCSHLHEIEEQIDVINDNEL